MTGYSSHLNDPLSSVFPQDPEMHRHLSELKRAQGDELAALAHLIAAQTLEACAGQRDAQALQRLCNVATGYFLKGDDLASEGWYRLLLKLDPDVATAYQNLCAICARTGRPEEAERFRARAYQLQRVFVESPANPVRQLLILCAGRSSANIPFDTLLSSGASCRIKYAIDYAGPDEDARLPPFDLVFNAIGEPDVAYELMTRLEHFVARCGRPVLNAPASVARTRRHQLDILLGDLEDVVIAPCVRGDQPPSDRGELLRCLDAAGIVFPVLARPEATHGGEGLECLADPDALEQKLRALNGEHYLTQYYDYRSADGFFRKYRMIFVDREPLPYHLAISPHWMVHYFSSEMEPNPWKIEEEYRFLQDPAVALGARAMNAIRLIGQRLDLDYAGIDFTRLPDGRVLVFEANATMLVHRERIDGLLAHKNPYIQRIVDAFEALQARRTPAKPQVNERVR